MSGRTLAQRKQKRPFETIEAEAYVNILRTADTLARQAEQVLKPAGLSGPQYNVLRILRGAGSEGLACREIGERLIAHDPDITRLLDRLEKRGMISRARDRHDRRVVTTRITREGLRILKELDRPMLEAHRRQLGHLRPRKLAMLVRLLEQARAAADNGM